MGGKKYQTTSNSVVERQAARSPRVSDVAALFFIAFCALLVLGISGAVLWLVSGNIGWLKAGAGGGALAFVLIYLGAVVEYRELLWATERRSGADINKDGHVGRPPIVIDGRKTQRRYAQQAANEEKLAWATFIKLVAEREQQQRKTGQRALRGFALTPNYSVSDEFHATVGATLIDAGFAKRDLDGGWSLSAPLDDVLAALDVWQL